ncbi:MAG: DUF4861 domain-containing protein, partial [Muribaculaceae bacterium]|nr:DUF4861 domain-containing protein [Muribaculaceae bacterium]
MKLTGTAMAVAAVMAVTACSSRQEIIVDNPSGADALQEMASLDASLIEGLTPGEFRILDADGNEVPYQLTFNGQLIFPASVKAGQSAAYTIVAGQPAPVDTLVWGRQFPERKDDMAWEHDRGAFRAYGPALQQSGERAFGYDIWTKSVPHPVLEKRFRLDREEKISFHVDHGEGMDVYAVGPTLGGGTAALIYSTGAIVYPYCYESYEILDNGPLRFTVRLTYGPITVDTDSAVVEQRVISLDRGSWLNRTTVTYSGLTHDATIAPGIVIHDANPEGFTLADGYMAYADPTQDASNGNGTIFVGIVAPQSSDFIFKPFDKPVGDAIGHILAPA